VSRYTCEELDENTEDEEEEEEWRLRRLQAAAITDMAPAAVTR
jgi:hypothetical protein